MPEAMRPEKPYCELKWEIPVKMDSELIMRQLAAKYRSKEFKQLLQQTLQLLRVFKSYSVEHIPRELDKAADALSRRALRGMGN